MHLVPQLECSGPSKNGLVVWSVDNQRARETRTRTYLKTMSTFMWKCVKFFQKPWTDAAREVGRRWKRRRRGGFRCRASHRAECGNRVPEVVSQIPVLIEQHSHIASGRGRGGKARKAHGETMVVLRRPPTPATVKRWWFCGDHQHRKLDETEGALIAAPHGVVVGKEVDEGSDRVLQLSEDLAIEHHDTALVKTVRRSPPVRMDPPSVAHHGALWTLRTSLTPGVCNQDREIRTETPAGRRRRTSEMTHPKLATVSHKLMCTFVNPLTQTVHQRSTAGQFSIKRVTARCWAAVSANRIPSHCLGENLNHNSCSARATFTTSIRESTLFSINPFSFTTLDSFSCP